MHIIHLSVRSLKFFELVLMSYWFLHHDFNRIFGTCSFIFVWEWLYMLFKKVSFNNSNKGRQHTRADAYVGGSGNLWKLSSSSFTLLSQRCDSVSRVGEWMEQGCSLWLQQWTPLEVVAIIWRGCLGTVFSPAIVQVPRCTHREGRVEFSRSGLCLWGCPRSQTRLKQRSSSSTLVKSAGSSNAGGKRAGDITNGW